MNASGYVHDKRQSEYCVVLFAAFAYFTLPVCSMDDLQLLDFNSFSGREG